MSYLCYPFLLCFSYLMSQAYRRLVSELGDSVRKMAIEAAEGGKPVPTARALTAELQGTGR